MSAHSSKAEASTEKGEESIKNFIINLLGRHVPDEDIREDVEKFKKARIYIVSDLKNVTPVTLQKAGIGGRLLDMLDGYLKPAPQNDEAKGHAGVPCRKRVHSCDDGSTRSAVRCKRLDQRDMDRFASDSRIVAIRQRHAAKIAAVRKLIQSNRESALTSTSSERMCAAQ